MSTLEGRRLSVVPQQQVLWVRLGQDAGAPAALRLPRSVDEALRDVTEWPADLLPGRGHTRRLWEWLASLAATDLAVARAVESHLDAQAILDQAQPVLLDGGGRRLATWGVFASETPTHRLRATRAPGEPWRLYGVKPSCALVDRLDGALVTAQLPGEGDDRGLFVVDLRDPGLEDVPEAWVSRGLREIPSTALRFTDVRGDLVRDGDWYVQRPGCWWARVGVAACWYGGAVGIARRVLRELRQRPDDRLLAMHVGRIDERLAAARHSLAYAAAAVDLSGAATDGGRKPEEEPARSAGRLLARRTRATVARACEDVVQSAAHALGQTPLCEYVRSRG